MIRFGAQYRSTHTAETYLQVLLENRGFQAILHHRLLILGSAILDRRPSYSVRTFDQSDKNKLGSHSMCSEGRSSRMRMIDRHIRADDPSLSALINSVRRWSDGNLKWVSPILGRSRSKASNTDTQDISMISSTSVLTLSSQGGGGPVFEQHHCGTAQCQMFKTRKRRCIHLPPESITIKMLQLWRRYV